MDCLIASAEIKEKSSFIAKIVVNHLIKGLIINGENSFRSNVFYELKIKESEEICKEAIHLAEKLGYFLSFEEYRGCTFSCIKYN